MRNGIHNYTKLAFPLTQMTRKKLAWKGGELPPAAAEAFRALQKAICQRPVLAFVDPDRPYSLYVDASLGVQGDEREPGGLGAVLTQTDRKGRERPVMYLSRGLTTYEKSYTAYLLELRSAVWAIEQLQVYLTPPQRFALYTDHQPLQALNKTTHVRTLNRLQELMSHYNFSIHYKKGLENWADYLSRNPPQVAAVEMTGLHPPQIAELQKDDEFLRVIRRFIEAGVVPGDSSPWRTLVKQIGVDCFLENDIVYMTLRRKNLPPRIVLLAPSAMHGDIVRLSHDSFFSGHAGQFKCRERILQHYWWPGFDAELKSHLQSCHRCQTTRTDAVPDKQLLTPLQQTDHFGQRVHTDLYGPLLTGARKKKYIWIAVDQHTRYVELAILEDKTPESVASAFYSRWICRYGAAAQILVSDQGKEFTAKMMTELYKLMQVDKRQTTARHPQCNSQAELLCKHITRYLRTVTDKVDEWESCLPALALAWNTSCSKATLETPFYLLHGWSPPCPCLMLK